MDLLQLLRERPLILDGATGSNLQRLGLGPDDFDGHEGCHEVLVRTRPALIQDLHRRFLEVGCLAVETNSFGASAPVLAEYGLAAEAYALNRRAAELALEVASGFQSSQRPRFVAGSIGPGNKLPSLGQIGFQELRQAYREQVAGLLEGGVQLLVVETCQDLLQVRAALLAIRDEQARLGRGVPLVVSLTLEPTGSLLAGADLSAALASLLPLQPDLLCLNCATGPLEMKQHLGFLSRQAPCPIGAQPNAGIPENRDGQAVYPLSPAELADWLASFVEEEGAQLVGGCCGTTPEHLAAVVERLEGLRPAPRRPSWEPALASAYSAVSLRQEPRPLLIGERTNANGSKRFRELLLEGKLDQVSELGREQERAGAHALDLCTAYAGRDEGADMEACMVRLARSSRLPLCIDSTQPEVMERALRLHPGRCLLNSVNLEEGEPRARRVLELARQHGAAVVALAIDEQGMARETARKLAVCERLYQLALEVGLAPSSLVFDLLTFTVASGEAELGSAARETLEAIRLLKQQHPEVFTILGVSNVSYGLKPLPRRVLNSVFLHLAVEQGLDLAIVEAGRLLPLARLSPELRELAEALLLCRPLPGHPQPLHSFLRLFEKSQPTEAGQSGPPPPLLEQLRSKIVLGEAGELELLLAAALTRQSAVEILTGTLIPAMEEVGRLFAAGQMQLPFVLQAAEVMKQAVSFLEPLLEEGSAGRRGTVVLATVVGDVHDIGKNLVDIILANNGYRVINLGIKVPVEEMIRVWREQAADAIAMSGLLVKSTQIMKENLLELRRRGLRPTVLLGGAALTRRFVEEELAPAYGPVHYCRDGFEALGLLADAAASPPAGAPPPALKPEPAPASPGRDGASLALAARPGAASVQRPPAASVPAAPWLGVRALELSLPEVLAALDEKRLFRQRWHYRRGHLEEAQHQRQLEQAAQALQRWRQNVIDEGLLRPRALCGFFACRAEGDQLLLLEGDRPLLRFGFPRQARPPHLCLADFFRPAGEGTDLLGAMLVSVGEEASLRIAELFATHRYRDLLHLHGLAVEAAEVATGLVQAKLVGELGLPGPGARFSFGYPACPSLEDQRLLLELLGADQIGVSVTETGQMVPEQSVTALLLHHPAAAQFRF